MKELHRMKDHELNRLLEQNMLQLKQNSSTEKDSEDKNKEPYLQFLKTDLQTHQIELEMQNRDLQAAQRELEYTRDLFADLYDYAPVGYLTLDKNGTISEANLTAASMLGKNRENLSRKPFSSYIDAGYRHLLFQHLRDAHVAMQKNAAVELKMNADLPSDVRYIRLESRTREHHSLPRAIRTAIIDITEKTELEKKQEAKDRVIAQEKRSSEMAEMMGAAIAHQGKEPLNTLSVILQDLKEENKEGQTGYDYVEKVVSDAMEQIHYLTETVSDFRNYFRPGQAIEFDVRELLESAIRLLQGHFIGHGVSLSIMGHGFHVYGEESKFKHIILNLLNNARESIEERRDTASKVSGEIQIHLKPEAKSIDIVDNGTGIDPAMLSDIFRPKVSLKNSDDNTGLGLYVVKSIIEDEFGGSIDVQNNQKTSGATFTLHFR